MEKYTPIEVLGKYEPTVVTEWGAELTWPDGHVEVRTRSSISGQQYQRRDAELSVANNNRHRDGDHAEGDTLPKVTARLVARAITTTPWAPVAQ